jgi:TRAP-type C4-dicarboxylate transport system permease small subunit
MTDLRSAATSVRRRPDARRSPLLRLLIVLPKAVVVTLLALAIADMLAGVFFRYIMVEITDLLDLDPINFFWVEEVGEFSLTWLTMIGAAVGIAECVHFTLRVLTHHFPARWQHLIHIANHLLIAAFGLLAAWQGMRLAITNSALTSPALQLNLGWVYASVAVGGVLIAVYAVALAAAGPAPVEGR